MTLVPGCIPRAVKFILNQSGVRVTMSSVEIYNEQIRDLLTGSKNGLNTPLKARERETMEIEGVTKRRVGNLAQFAEIFKLSCKNRVIGSTALNATSSRSHVCVTVVVEFGDYVGKINFVDLAGSENNKKTQNEGIRLKESGRIHASLLALHKVIDCLNDKHNSGQIPYRDSKLTYLLKDSLGGGR